MNSGTGHTHCRQYGMRQLQSPEMLSAARAMPEDRNPPIPHAMEMNDAARPRSGIGQISAAYAAVSVSGVSVRRY